MASALFKGRGRHVWQGGVLCLALATSACAARQPDMAEVLAEVMANQRASMVAVGGRPGPAASAGLRPSETSGLLGAPPEVLVGWLGEPRLRRSEDGAEIWLYQAQACHLDVVLYPEAGRLRVAYAAARATGTQRQTEAGCLRELGQPSEIARAGG